jgi:hypothetical protein
MTGGLSVTSIAWEADADVDCRATLLNDKFLLALSRRTRNTIPRATETIVAPPERTSGTYALVLMANISATNPASNDNDDPPRREIRVVSFIAKPFE